MKHLGFSLAIAVLAVVMVTACGKPTPAPQPPTTTAAPTSPASAPAAAGEMKYTCSMHPEVVANVPGKCPKCDMELVAMTGAAGADSASAKPACTCKVDEPGCKCGHCSTGQGMCVCGKEHDHSAH